MDVPLRDERVVLHVDQFGNPFVRLGTEGDGVSCGCCASECAQTLDVSASFCGMTVNLTVPIPGEMFQGESLPDGSFLFMGAQVFCSPCGWVVAVFISGFCEETSEFVSADWTGLVLFSDVVEADGTSCPRSGAVDLVCPAAEFGFPCGVTPVASIT
jgi:hypothetical protein